MVAFKDVATNELQVTGYSLKAEGNVQRSRAVGTVIYPYHTHARLAPLAGHAFYPLIVLSSTILLPFQAKAIMMQQMICVVLLHSHQLSSHLISSLAPAMTSQEQEQIMNAETGS